MIEYPKIETLFDRNLDNMKEIINGQWRLPEFEMLKDAPIWHVTEKIDGTNIRVLYFNGTVGIRGRTDNAQLPPGLESMLLAKLPPELFQTTLGHDGNPSVCLYGEAYGPKIQSGGWYRADMGFRIFDVKINDWWLNWDDVVDVANKLDIATAPVLRSHATIEEALAYVKEYSGVAAMEGGDQDRFHEGIIARTDPILLMRNGKRLMWKMKVRDLPK